MINASKPKVRYGGDYWRTPHGQHVPRLGRIVSPKLVKRRVAWRERKETNFQSISLDYRRFQSDSLLECYKLEYEAVKAYLFVLNHNAVAAMVDLGEQSGTVLISGRTLQGGKAELTGRNVWIVKLN